MKNQINLKKILSSYWKQIKKYKKSAISIHIFYTTAVLSSTLATPLFYKKIIDLISTTTNKISIYNELIALLSLILLNSIFYNIFYRLGGYSMTYFQTKVSKELALFSFNSLQKHSYSFFNNNFSGALVAKTNRFINSFHRLHDELIYSINFRFLVIIIYIITITFFSLTISFIYISWLILYGIIVYFFVKKQTSLDIDAANTDSMVTSRLSDNISNILNIKIFANQEIESKNFLTILTNQEKKVSKSWYFKDFQNVITGILFIILEISVMYIAINKWVENEITAGAIVVIQIYIIGSFDIVWNFGRSIVSIQKSFTDAKEMVDIFESSIAIQDIKTPEKSHIKNGKIEFLDVTFNYEKNKNIFTSFNLSIESGEKIGLVGHSGAGKSTVINLLLRFIDITNGRIEIDGQDISKISQTDLRKNISYVPQESILFHRSIFENIAYGKISATKEEVIEASKKAHAHDFIIKLKDGYNTLVGERGIKLSGGERQRIAIARSMLKNAPILILDEATSALDSISEKHIQSAFEELMKNKTTLVIAHRLSTIQKMDRIIVLDNGNIAEEGTHKQLIEKNSGIYNAFWQAQTKEFLND